MNMPSDAEIGRIIFILAVIVFIYYVFWVSILPFMLIEEDNWLHSFFPSLHYAYLLPAGFGVLFLGLLFCYTVYNILIAYKHQANIQID